jgi:hypothetical protein
MVSVASKRSRRSEGEALARYTRLALTLAGVLLISVGLLVSAGWPFVVGGLILLLAAARTN